MVAPSVFWFLSYIPYGGFLRAVYPRRHCLKPDAARGEFVRSCFRGFRDFRGFHRLVRDRGPRVTWAEMARSPRRLPRRPADSLALPLQHTQTDSRPLMFRHDMLFDFFIFFDNIPLYFLFFLFRDWRTRKPALVFCI